jgi:hypothetical protein
MGSEHEVSQGSQGATNTERVVEKLGHVSQVQG